MRTISGISTGPTSSGPDDLHLVRSAVRGEPDAVEEVLARLGCVVRFVYRLNRRLGYGLPTESLEDVVQQVYAALWPRLCDFQGSAALESWAFGFCRNCLRSEARRRQSALRLAPVEDDGAAAAAAQTNDARRGDPGATLCDLEGLDALRDELDRLAPDDRAVVELRHLEDWSFERIARHLGQPASTVKDRCYRVLSKMRGRLRRRDIDVDADA